MSDRSDRNPKKTVKCRPNLRTRGDSPVPRGRARAPPQPPRAPAPAQGQISGVRQVPERHGAESRSGDVPGEGRRGRSWRGGRRRGRGGGAGAAPPGAPPLAAGAGGTQRRISTSPASFSGERFAEEIRAAQVRDPAEEQPSASPDGQGARDDFTTFRYV